MDKLSVRFTSHLKSRGDRIRIALIALIIFFILSCLFTAFYLIQSSRNRQIVIEELVNQEQAYFEVTSISVQDAFQRSAEDLFILSEYIASLDGPPLQEQQKAQFRNLFTQVSTHHSGYDAITLLESGGDEILKIVRTGETASALPAESLGKDTQYVSAAALECGSLYLTSLTLAMEGEKYRLPHTPVLRIATPLFTAEGEPSGMVAISYRADTLFDLIRKVTETYPSEFFLLNQQGHFLINDRNPEYEFAYLFPGNGEDMTLSFMDEALAEKVRTKEKGFTLSEDGLYIFHHIYPFRETSSSYTTIMDCASCAEEVSWTLVSFYSESYLKTFTRQGFLLNAIELIVIFILISLLSILLAAFWFQKSFRLRYIRSLAREDQLTGALSRTWGLHQAERILSSCRETGNHCAFLYIDLDRFKDVNDTYGHEAGDEVLRNISERVLNLIRHDDMFIRLGGDEFLVVLSSLRSREETALVAKRIHEQIIRPVTSESSQEIVTIDCCIGSAFFPENGDTLNAMMNISDKAMYEAKRSPSQWYGEIMGGAEDTG